MQPSHSFVTKMKVNSSASSLSSILFPSPLNTFSYFNIYQRLVIFSYSLGFECSDLLVTYTFPESLMTSLFYAEDNKVSIFWLVTLISKGNVWIATKIITLALQCFCCPFKVDVLENYQCICTKNIQQLNSLLLRCRIETHDCLFLSLTLLSLPVSHTDTDTIAH